MRWVLHSSVAIDWRLTCHNFSRLILSCLLWLDSTELLEFWCLRVLLCWLGLVGLRMVLELNAVHGIDKDIRCFAGENSLSVILSNLLTPGWINMISLTGLGWCLGCNCCAFSWKFPWNVKLASCKIHNDTKFIKPHHYFTKCNINHIFIHYTLLSDW